MPEPLLPLFPLELVLFPGQRLPLHIFEERYKTMIEECLREQQEFGVVLAKENSIVNVGCTAAVLEVRHKYADGRMDIVTAGRRRFEVLFVDESKEYLRAAAQFFQDEESPAPEQVRSSALDLHRQVLELLPDQGRPQQAQHGVDDASPLSFRLVGPLPVDLDFKQSLLALRSESTRLERVVEYFQHLITRLERTAWVRARAGGNGHC